MDLGVNAKKRPACRLEIGDPSRLCSFAVVVSEETTDSLSALEFADQSTDVWPTIDQVVLEALMVSLPVIVGEKLANGFPQGVLPEEDHPIEALRFQRSHESLNESVQIRRPGGQPDGFHGGLLKNAAKCLAELGVAIHENVPVTKEEAIGAVRQIPGDLFHPCGVRVCCTTGEANTPSSEFHDKQ